MSLLLSLNISHVKEDVDDLSEDDNDVEQEQKDGKKLMAIRHSWKKKYSAKENKKTRLHKPVQ